MSSALGVQLATLARRSRVQAIRGADLEIKCPGVEIKVRGLEIKYRGIEIKVRGVEIKYSSLDIKVWSLDFKYRSLDHEMPGLDGLPPGLTPETSPAERRSERVAARTSNGPGRAHPSPRDPAASLTR